MSSTITGDATAVTIESLWGMKHNEGWYISYRKRHFSNSWSMAYKHDRSRGPGRAEPSRRLANCGWGYNLDLYLQTYKDHSLIRSLSPTTVTDFGSIHLKHFFLHFFGLPFARPNRANTLARLYGRSEDE